MEHGETGLERVPFTWPANGSGSVGNAYGRITRRVRRCCKRRSGGGLPDERVADGVTLRLKAAKVKELVPDDMSARCAAELFQFHGRFRLEGAVSVEMVEKIAGVKRIRAAKAIGGAVYLVRS